MEQEVKEYKAFGKKYHVPKIIHDQYEVVTDILRGKDTTSLDREASLKVLANVLIPIGKEWTKELEAEQLEEFHRIDMETEVAVLQYFFVGYVSITNSMIGVLEILEMQNELSKMNLPKLLEQLQNMRKENLSELDQRSSINSPAEN